MKKSDVFKMVEEEIASTGNIHLNSLIHKIYDDFEIERKELLQYASLMKESRNGFAWDRMLLTDEINLIYKYHS